MPSTEIERPSEAGQSSEVLSQNGIRLVNKDQNMLHKLSLDANSIAISYWQV